MTESLKEKESKTEDIKKAFDNKCKEFDKSYAEFQSLKVVLAEKDSESMNVKEKHRLEMENIKSSYNSMGEKFLKEKEKSDNIFDEKIKKITKENDMLRLSLADLELKFKTNDEKHVAEKRK